MKRYLIKEILLADTYERIALVKRLSDDKEIFVYFLSHDDFVTDIKEKRTWALFIFFIVYLHTFTYKIN